MSVKTARIRCCNACEQGIVSGGWGWPRCAATAVEIKDMVDRDDAFMETGNCPLGLWDDLVAVDVAGENLAHLIESASEFRTKLDPILKRLSSQDRIDALLEMVESEAITGPYAVEIQKLEP